MKSDHISSRGQILIIFVFAIVGLIAMTGLAIDGGNIYSDRRHAQNAADTAALAAALHRNNWEKGPPLQASGCDYFNTETRLLPPCSGRIIGAALDIAAKNGYDSNPAHQNRVDVYSPPKDGPYADCSASARQNFDCENYIEVIIKDDVDTWFIKVLGIRQLHNQVAAVALADYSPTSDYYGGNTLVELATGHSSCPSDFDVSGSGTVTLDGGGIFVNSTTQNCAYKQQSCAGTVVTENGATIQVSQPGGWDISQCSTAPAPISSPLHYDFPPKHIFSAPSECGTPGTGHTVGGVTTYTPGSYGSFPTVNGPSILQSGVYCVDNLKTTKDISSQAGGVFIYIRPTGEVDISGKGGPDPKIILSAITTDPYAGFLIYGDWDLNSALNRTTCTIAGGTNSQYSGMIFVPYCKLNISGNSTADGNKAQIVAGMITLGGDLNLTFKWDSSELPKIPEENWTGLSR